MSAHFSKFSLNTYSPMAYFRAHIPADYPLSLVLQNCRAFRRLPPRLRKLAGLAKQWAKRVYAKDLEWQPDGIGGIDRWYDDEGYELDYATGKRLTDAEIESSWQGFVPKRIKVKDIPEPPEGFADPATWEAPREEDEEDLVDREGLTEARGHALRVDAL